MPFLDYKRVNRFPLKQELKQHDVMQTKYFSNIRLELVVRQQEHPEDVRHPHIAKIEKKTVVQKVEPA